MPEIEESHLPLPEGCRFKVGDRVKSNRASPTSTWTISGCRVVRDGLQMILKEHPHESFEEEMFYHA